jgi:hypothetical protein
MNIIVLIRFLFANKEVVKDLIELINEIIGMFSGGQATIMTESIAEVMGVKYSALGDQLKADGFSFFDLIQLLIENKESLKEIVEWLISILGAKK